jgi:hypothetical protein
MYDKHTPQSMAFSAAIPRAYRRVIGPISRSLSTETPSTAMISENAPIVNVLNLETDFATLEEGHFFSGAAP